MAYEYNTGGFGGVEERAVETAKWQARYHGLIRALKASTTEVRMIRTLEEDKDSAPFHFVQDAFHDFIFPPQVVEQSGSNSGPIDTTPGYTLQKEDRTYSYHEDWINGHILVYYDDADSRIEFTVDLKKDDDRPMPQLATTALDRAFAE